MAIRTRLSRKLHQTLGDEAAEDLVNWMQQIDAQRAELRELNELNFSRFDARLADMRADLAELRQEMQVGLARLETKLEQRTADLIKWSFVFWVGAVGAIAALAGVLR
jgi:hypothetical protein